MLPSALLVTLTLWGAEPLPSAEARDWHFINDIVPIFNRFGCNSSGCHGKAEGQSGFKLSVFGFDPEADYSALTQESRGRRVTRAIPEQSLLLRKSSGGSPHGGGVRIPRHSEEYRTLRDWVAAGMPYGRPDAPRVIAIRVDPSERQLTFGSTQPLRVTAMYSDGRQVDATHHARFQSNREAIATVDEHGVVTAQAVAGDVAIMAAYMDATALFTALVPRSEPLLAGDELPPLHPLDRLVDAKLAKLRIQPSPLCDDATFLRRAHLDVIGRLPTVAETRAFLQDHRADKRAQLVRALLERPEFADYWALQWSDWLRVDRQALGHLGAYRYYRWIRDSFADNRPLDRFARELIEADGLLADRPAGHFYKVAKDPGDAAAMLSQALLGVRIDCAKCHHHPYDRWGQDDYFGMQAFFAPLSFKPTPHGEMLLARKSDVTKHPRSEAPIFAHALGEPMPVANPPGDRRPVLAAWLTSPDNPYFARNIANRAWAHFLGRGLVEPVDDVRSTNPPSNPELLDALARDLVESGFDFRHLIRTIAATRTYQASTAVNPSNTADEQNYSRALLRRLDAEVLLDALCDATGVPEKFHGVPAGSRAVQLWDSQVSHYFLTTAGRPTRTTVCECERVAAPSVAGVLHGLNAPSLEGKLAHDGGRVAQLVAAHPHDDERVIEDLYLAFFSRLPTEPEQRTARRHLATHGPVGRRAAAEDLAWSLMNSLEFVFNH
ncbi:MAG TPA: DUF1549 and DUF1553 domain-containing protein [Planctomycetaceae bacterium]|nr:DUF1549 and DUF1553 domain-containing protein [Planctomycetaceae bacterium]